MMCMIHVRLRMQNDASFLFKTIFIQEDTPKSNWEFSAAAFHELKLVFYIDFHTKFLFKMGNMMCCALSNDMSHKNF